MAENQIFRAGVGRGLHKNVNIVNPFAHERSFPKKILIDIRRHHRIGIIARYAAAHGGVTSLTVAWYLLRKAGL